MRTLIIADNQDITRAGLRALFARNPAVGAVCEARSKSDLIRNLRLAPDAVVILDYAWSISTGSKNFAFYAIGIRAAVGCFSRRPWSVHCCIVVCVGRGLSAWYSKDAIRMR